jgi:Fe-S-cluster-containing hydrogenase component 2
MDAQPTHADIPQVNRQACRMCARCLGVRVCPAEALQQVARGARPVVLAERCQGCLDCVLACPVGGLIPPQSLLP